MDSMLLTTTPVPSFTRLLLIRPSQSHVGTWPMRAAATKSRFSPTSGTRQAGARRAQTPGVCDVTGLLPAPYL